MLLSLRQAGRSRGNTVGLVWCLNLAFLVNAENGRHFRRIEIDPYDIAELVDGVRIFAGLESLDPMRLQPNAEYGCYR